MINIHILQKINFHIKYRDTRVYWMSLGISIIFLLLTPAYPAERHSVVKSKGLEGWKWASEFPAWGKEGEWPFPQAISFNWTSHKNSLSLQNWLTSLLSVYFSLSSFSPSCCSLQTPPKEIWKTIILSQNQAKLKLLAWDLIVKIAFVYVRYTSFNAM